MKKPYFFKCVILLHSLKKTIRILCKIYFFCVTKSIDPIQYINGIEVIKCETMLVPVILQSIWTFYNKTKLV